MCHPALIMKSAMKTAVMGTSTLFSFLPPSDHVVGSHGPFWCIYAMLEELFAGNLGGPTIGDVGMLKARLSA
jgi:hypothetical protein